MSSIWDQVVAAALVLAHNLDLPGIPVDNRQTRKLPTAQESLDNLPALLLVPADRPEDLALAATHIWNVPYHIDFVIITASNLDLTLDTSIPLWQQTLRQAVSPPLCIAGSVVSIWNTNVKPWAPLDRRKLNRNYNYSGVSVDFISEEPF